MNENLLDEIRNYFPCQPVDIRTIPALKLAYLGDAVFEIMIRTIILDSYKGAVKDLHAATSSLVNAKTQARISNCILPILTDDEASAFRHGKNAKPSSVAKNAELKDYKRATGLEALWGYLYLQGQSKRAVELLKYACDELKLLNID